MRQATQRVRTLRTATILAGATTAVLATQAVAQTWVGTGGSTGSPKFWNDPANWSGGVPTQGAATVLDFSTVNAAYVSSNNIAASFDLNRLILGSSVSGQQITGSSLEFVNNGSVGPQVLQNGAGSFSLPTMSVGSGVTLELTGTGTGQVTFNGVAGAGALRVNGTGEYILASNSFLGGVTLDAGRVVLSQDSGLGNAAGILTINGGSLRAGSAADRNIANPVRLAGNASLLATVPNTGSVVRAVNYNGGITLMGSGATRVLTLGRPAGTTPVSTDIAARLNGPIGQENAGNGLTVQGTGTLVIGNNDTNANPYSGATTVNGASTILLLNKADGTVAVAGALNVGAGTLGLARGNQIADASAVTVSGGTLLFAPDGSSGGVSETIGSLTQTSGTFRTNPSNAASDNAVTVNGNLSVTGGTFNVGVNSTLSSDGATLSSTTSNAYVVGGTLAVGAGGLTLNQPNLTNGNIVDVLALVDGSNAGTLRLSGDVTLNATGGANAATRIRRGSSTGKVDLNGAVRTFTVADTDATSDLILSANLDGGAGSGVIKTGPGRMALFNNASYYSGTTRVDAGTLSLSGATVTGAVLVNGGTLAGHDAGVAGVGVAGGITLASGTIAPDGLEAAGSSSRGNLIATSLTVTGAGSFAYEVASPTDADRITIADVTNAGATAGDVGLGDGLASLSLTGINGYAAADTDLLWLIVNSGAGQITGYFAGLTDGSTVALGGKTGWIYYGADFEGGSLSGGNDVVVSFTQVPEPSAAAVLLAVGGLLGLRRRR